jgi:hypothetical protein
MSVGEPALWRTKVDEWERRRSPAHPFLDASENDTPGKCVCEKCMALDEPASDADASDRRSRAHGAFLAGKDDWFVALGSLSDRYARYYLAIQREAERVDPQAVVLGLIYANYSQPPKNTHLNDRIVLGLVPEDRHPWDARALEEMRRQWDGWSATGARLLLRPNFTLEGHAFPLASTTPAEAVAYAMEHGAIGTDLDSLTGQWATQGPLLYAVARVHEPQAPGVSATLHEFYAGFGPADGAVERYFEHWHGRGVAAAGASSSWSSFHASADLSLGEVAFAEGWQLLAVARLAAAGDATSLARVAFLEKGLRNAELTAGAARAARGYREHGRIRAFVDAIERLDAFRSETETDRIANVGFLSWAEAHSWDRSALARLGPPGKRLGSAWQTHADPGNGGERLGWAAPEHDDGGWRGTSVSDAWVDADPGADCARPRQGESLWLRTRFAAPTSATGDLRLAFARLEADAAVWVNGKRLGAEPAAASADVQGREVVVRGSDLRVGDNVLVVRTSTCAQGASSIGQVWIVDAPGSIGGANLIADGSFDEGRGAWKQDVRAGAVEFAVDAGIARSGGRSARIVASEGRPGERARPWGRWVREVAGLERGERYVLRAWYRTSPGFNAVAKAWVVNGTAGTIESRGLGTSGLWRALTLQVVAAAPSVTVYLNLVDGAGTLWFDDVSLQRAP